MSAETFIANFIDATDFQVPVEITLDTPLCALAEWDSLAALGVIVMFDMIYKQSITGEDLYAATTVGDLYRKVG